MPANVADRTRTMIDKWTDQLACFLFKLFPATSVQRTVRLTIESVTCATGWNQCFNMKLFVRKSSGEEILYLDKQCGLDFVCNQPDPNYVCNIKNTTFTDQEHTLVNCTSRSCTTDMCNNDDLTPPPPAPSTPVITHPMPSIALSINASGLHSNQTGTNAIVAPSTPENGTSSTMATPADCGKGSLKWIKERVSLYFGGGGLIQNIFKLSLINLYWVKYLKEAFNFWFQELCSSVTWLATPNCYINLKPNLQQFAVAIFD